MYKEYLKENTMAIVSWLHIYTDTSYSLQCSRRVAHDGIVARLMVWYEHDNYDKWVMLSLFCWKAERHGEDWPVSSSTKCYHIHLSTCCGYGYFSTSSYIFNTMTFLNLICILAHDIILWPTFSCPVHNLIPLQMFRSTKTNRSGTYHETGVCRLWMRSINLHANER